MEDVEITEYHLCKECEHSLALIYDDNWEVVCLERRKELNKDGGLTDCKLFEEKRK